MKKTIYRSLVAAGLFLASYANAQSADMRNILKFGINGGIALPKSNASATIGADLTWQNLVAPGFGLGIATGYNHYFGRENGTIKNNDFGVVPVAALIKIYPKQSGFFIGTDLGYGFIVGNSQVASNWTTERPDGGFYIKPEIGYHNRDWNFAIQYRKVFTGDKGKILDQDYNAGALTAGIAYNIPLGK